MAYKALYQILNAESDLSPHASVPSRVAALRNLRSTFCARVSRSFLMKKHEFSMLILSISEVICTARAQCYLCLIADDFVTNFARPSTVR